MFRVTLLCNVNKKSVSIGANVNCQDYGNQTPLHYACFLGFSDVACLLLKCNAFVDAIDNKVHEIIFSDFFLLPKVVNH